MNKVVKAEVLPQELISLAEKCKLSKQDADSLLTGFTPFYKELQVLTSDNGIQITDPKIAKEKRLQIAKVRTSSDKFRKEIKEDVNNKAKAIQDFYNLIAKQCEEQETALKFIEDKAQREEEERIAKLVEYRKEQLLPYVQDVTIYNLQLMDDAMFDVFLQGQKTIFENAEKQRIEQDRIQQELFAKQEEERLEKEKENERLKAQIEAERLERERLEAERKAKIEERQKKYPFQLQSVGVSYTLLEVEQMSDEQFDAMVQEKQVMYDKQVAEAKAEQEKNAKEQERINKLREEQEKKAEEERKALEVENARIQAERDKLIADQEKARKDEEKRIADAKAEQLRIENKRIADEKAEQERLAEIERNKIAEEQKRKSAPDKEKLKEFGTLLVNLELPTMATEEGKTILDSVQKLLGKIDNYIKEQTK